MFYEGDLQSGINKAVLESKLVACFVTDDQQESQLWQSDFLEEPALKVLFSTQTVLLCLKVNSQEAGYLAAICPLPKIPTLVIIQNGQLKEYLAAGTSKDEFLRRVGVVLQRHDENATNLNGALPPSLAGQVATSTMAEQLPQPSQPTQGASDDNSCPTQLEGNAVATTTSQTAEPNRGLSATTEEVRSSEVQALFAERASKLKKERDAKGSADPAVKTEGKRQALEESALTGSKKSAEMKFALMQKKRQQDARDERARILKRVEDDKIERKEKEVLRKALAKERYGALPETPSSSSDLQSSNNGGIPYTFKQVLTPLPNKNISISDEELSLQSLELTPTSTLILVPVKGYTSAYEGSSTGLVSRGVSAGYGIVSSGVSTIAGVLGGLLGAGATTPPQERHDDLAPTTTQAVRTLRDQDRSADHQLYNGNALNFEPRRDDDVRKDD